jgi:hypothetical protein
VTLSSTMTSSFAAFRVPSHELKLTYWSSLLDTKRSGCVRALSPLEYKGKCTWSPVDVPSVHRDISKVTIENERPMHAIYLERRSSLGKESRRLPRALDLLPSTGQAGRGDVLRS